MVLMGHKRLELKIGINNVISIDDLTNFDAAVGGKILTNLIN